MSSQDVSNQDTYIALVSSLPSSERLFASKLPPLSRLRLERRLSVLTPEDRGMLADIEGVVRWSAYDMDATGAQAMARARTLLARLESETLRAIVMERLDLRTIIAALRKRRQGQGAPAKPWGFSRLTRHIIANWSDRTFKLENRMPWLPDAVTLLEERDPLGLERHMLDVTFRQLRRHAGRHLFDFEAVVIYVLKWNIFDRWAHADGRAATSRFETLTHQAFSREVLNRELLAQAALGDGFADLVQEGL